MGKLLGHLQRDHLVGLGCVVLEQELVAFITPADKPLPLPVSWGYSLPTFPRDAHMKAQSKAQLQLLFNSEYKLKP